MKSSPAVFLRVTEREWRALSNMEPICLLDIELKAGDGFKMGHKRYFIKKKGGFGSAGGRTMCSM